MLKFEFVNDKGSRTRSTCGGLFLCLLFLLGIVIDDGTSFSFGQEPTRQTDLKKELVIERPAAGVRLIGTKNSWVALNLQGQTAVLSSNGKHVYAVDRASKGLWKIDRETNQILVGTEFGEFTVGEHFIARLTSRFQERESIWKFELSILDLDLKTLQTRDVSPKVDLDGDQTTDAFVWVTLSDDSKRLLLIGNTRCEMFTVPTLEHLGGFEVDRLTEFRFLSSESILSTVDNSVWTFGSEKLVKADSPQLKRWKVLASRDGVLAVEDKGKVSIIQPDETEAKQLPVPATLVSYSYESAVISPSGDRLAAIGYQGQNAKLFVWDLKASELLASEQLPRNRFRPRFDEQDGLFLQHVVNGQFFAVPELDQLKDVIHENLVPASLDLQVVSDHTGNLAYFSGSGDRIIDLSSGGMVSVVPEMDWVQFSPNSELMVGHSFDERKQANQIHWVDVANVNESNSTIVDRMDSGVSNAVLGRLFGRRKAPPRLPSQLCTGIRFQNDGKLLNALLVMQSDGPVATRWNVGEQIEEQRVSLKDIEGMEEIIDPLVADFSPDGNWLVVGFQGQLFLVDLLKKEVVTSRTVLAGYTSESGLAQFSSDGRWVLLSDSVGLAWVEHALVLDATTLKERQRISKTNDRMICRFAKSAPRMMICDTGSGKVSWLNTDTWQIEGEHQAELGKIFNADISGDGQHVILSLVDTRIEVWDLEQLK